MKHDIYPEDAVTISFSCSPYDKYNITVVEYDSNSEVVTTTSGLALCMYVRREIRYLTDTDLDTFLDAAYTLWDVSEEVNNAVFNYL